MQTSQKGDTVGDLFSSDVQYQVPRYHGVMSGIRQIGARFGKIFSISLA